MTSQQKIGVVMCVCSLAILAALIGVDGMVLSLLKLATAPWFVCGIMLILWK